MPPAAPDVPMPTVTPPNIDGKGAAVINVPDYPAEDSGGEVQSVSSYDANAPSIETGASSAAASLTAPYLAQIEANRKKRELLRTMPITDKDGNTKGGWEIFGNEKDPTGDAARKKFTDTNGRFKSGMSAFLQSLAGNPQLHSVRSWGDLAKAVTYSGAAGIAGGVHSSWDEQQKRDIALQKLDAEDAQIKTQAGDALKMANQESVIDTRRATLTRQDAVFENRVNEQKYKKIQDEKKEVLKPIFKRGFFYHDTASPEELKRLEDAHIVLDDFDTTKKPRIDPTSKNLKVWDIAQKEYVTAEGGEPDEPLVNVEIDGQRIKLTPGQFANYKAAESQTNYRTKVADADNKQNYNDKLTKWKADEDKRQDESAKLANESNDKNTEYYEQKSLAEGYDSRADALAEENPAEAEKYREKAIIARSKASTLKTQSESLLSRSRSSKPLPKPDKQEKLPTYNSPVRKSGKYAGQNFSSPSILRSAFPGKSDTDIKQIIEANGGSFQP